MPLTITPFPPVLTGTTDGQSTLTIPTEAVGLINSSGTVDRWRESTARPIGSALVSDVAAQGMFTQLLDMLRAIFYAQLTTSQLLGSQRIGPRTDFLLGEDLLKLATANQGPTDPNSLQ